MKKSKVNPIQDNKNKSQDEWESVHVIQSYGSLMKGTQITYNLKGTTTSTLIVPLTDEETEQYRWPSVLASKITEKNSGIDIAGYWDEDGNLTQPNSSYLNEIYINKDDLPLYSMEYYISEQDNADIFTIKSRIEDSLSDFEADSGNADNYIALQEDDGSFSDISYPENNGVLDNEGSTQFNQHFARLEAIAWKYKMTPDDTYKNSVLNGVLFYVGYNYQDSQNWWYVNIGLPKRTVNCMIFIGGEVDNNDTLTITDYIYSVSDVNSPENNEGGANSVDYCYIVFVNAIFGLSSTNFPDDLSKHNFKIYEAVDKCNLLANFVTLPTPGILPDYSYADHNMSSPVVRAQLNLSYGVVYLDDLAHILSFAYGTSYALDETSIEIMGDHLIEGYGWMCYMGYFALDAIGRSTSRAMLSAQSDAIGVLIESGYSNQAALLELQNRIYSQDESQNEYFIGHRYYTFVDYVSTIQPSYTATLRMVSERTIGNESGNGEGLKSYYLGDGTSFFITTGSEYYDIQPVWDWERLPGTTTQLGVYGGETPFPLIDWGYGADGSSTFVGSVSNGTLCLSTMVLSKGNIIDAYKSYLMVPSAIFCFGTSIIAYPLTPTTAEVVGTTNVDQFIWDNNDILIYKIDGTTMTIDTVGNSYEGSDVKAIQIGTRRYEFPDTTTQYVLVSLTEQSGSWYDINTTKPDTILTSNIVNIGISHKDNDTYEYIVYPDYTESFQFITLNKDSDSHVLQTSENQLIVSNRSQDILELNLLESVNITLKSNCLLICNIISETSLDLFVSDPSQELETIELSIEGQYTGLYTSYDSDTGITNVSIPINTLEILGSSLTVNLVKS